MANILIDGYNLIGVSHRDFEKARSDLIQELSAYAKIKGHNITVVFDGWKNGQYRETKLRLQGINVIYSSLGEKADYVITKLLSSSTESWIVVSSDREISCFAEKKNLAAITSDAFERKLYSALGAGNRHVEHEEYEEDFEPLSKNKKGNPKKLSKKNKRVAEALKKL